MDGGQRRACTRHGVCPDSRITGRSSRLDSDIDRGCGCAGRDPRDITRSACVLVQLEADAVKRPHDQGVAPVEGDAEHIAGVLRDLDAAGADEAILVLRPITEASIRSLGDVLVALR